MNPPRYYSEHACTFASHGGNLPHWSQTCATFVTFRLGDSLPAGKLAEYEVERETWMAAHPEPWDESTAEEYRMQFPSRLQKWLDAGYGSCVLRDARVRALVEDVLRHFADVRYALYAYVVMPNHVHVLFMPEAGFDGRKIVANWKRYAAHAVNALLHRTGPLWQKESYDHLLRDVAAFNACRAYIRHNAPDLAYDAYVERNA